MIRLQVALAARYLWGRKLRTFLTTLAIVFGTLVIFGMNILLPSMLKAFQSNILAASGQVDVTVTLKTGEAFSAAVMNRLHTVAGIRAMAGSLSRTINIPDGYFGRRSGITALTLTGIDPRSAPTLRNYPIKEGRFLRAGDTTSAVIASSLADSLGLKVGDKLHLPTTEGDVHLKVVGLLPARALPGNEEVLVTLTEAQKLLDLDGRINTIEINLDAANTAQREAAQKAIQAALGSDYTLGGLSSGTEILASMQIGQIAMNLFGFLALFMGGFIIFNTFRTVVAERRHDMGMLRALGASRGTIIGLILTEGFLQGALGTLIGMVLGYLMGALILKFLQPTLTMFLHVQMGMPVVQPWLVVLTIASGIGVTLLAGLWPAFSASRVTPLEALRPSISETIQRTAVAGAAAGAVMLVLAAIGLASGVLSLAALGGLLFIVGIVLVAPALVKPIASVFSRLLGLAFARDGAGILAQSNLIRQPSRSAITASTTMVGLAIIVGLGGMVWSVSGGFLKVLERSLGSDYLIIPPSVGMWKSNVGAGEDLSNRLRATPGVGVVSSMRFATASANGTAVSLLGIDPATYPKVASLTFQAGDPKTAYAALDKERSLIANGLFVAQAGLHVGDVVRLSTPTGDKPYRIIAIAGDYLNAKVTTAYISQTYLEKDFRKDEDILFQINLAPGADATRVEAKLRKILADYPQFKLLSGRSYIEENKQIFNAVFVFYFVLLGVLAAPSLIALLNTLAIGVIERTREIGMLRAIGATRRQVRRMVIAESLLLAGIGTAFGLLAGLYLGYVMVLGLSVTGIPVVYVFPYAGLVAAIAAGLIFGVLAALIPARQAAGMEIVRALRYE
jgi:putative ABC transport system permease protein